MAASGRTVPGDDAGPDSMKDGRYLMLAEEEIPNVRTWSSKDPYVPAVYKP